MAGLKSSLDEARRLAAVIEFQDNREACAKLKLPLSKAMKIHRIDQYNVWNEQEKARAEEVASIENLEAACGSHPAVLMVQASKTLQ